MYKWTKLFSHKIIKTSKSEKSAFGWLNPPCPPMSPHVLPSSVHPQMDSDSPWLSSSIVTSWRRSQSSRRRESSPLLIPLKPESPSLPPGWCVHCPLGEHTSRGFLTPEDGAAVWGWFGALIREEWKWNSGDEAWHGCLSALHPLRPRPHPH